MRRGRRRGDEQEVTGRESEFEEFKGGNGMVRQYKSIASSSSWRPRSLKAALVAVVYGGRWSGCWFSGILASFGRHVYLSSTNRFSCLHVFVKLNI